MKQIASIFFNFSFARQYIYWTQKETLQSSWLYNFFKCDYMTFVHLVKIVRDVFEDKCQIWTRLSDAKLL